MYALVKSSISDSEGQEFRCLSVTVSKSGVIIRHATHWKSPGIDWVRYPKPTDIYVLSGVVESSEE